MGNKNHYPKSAGNTMGTMLKQETVRFEAAIKEDLIDNTDENDKLRFEKLTFYHTLKRDAREECIPESHCGPVCSPDDSCPPQPDGYPCDPEDSDDDSLKQNRVSKLTRL